MKDIDLLVIGEINPDLILSGDITPVFNQTEKLVDDATLAIGSSSVIMACGAARLGLKTAFIGIVGDDVFGTFMLNAMREKKIDVSSCVVNKDLTTGFSVILVKPDSDRAILTHSGSISELRLSNIDKEMISRTHHLHLGGFFLLKKLRPDIPNLFKFAHEEKSTISLDPNWDPENTWDIDDILPYCDVFLPNQAEVERITGVQFSQGIDLLAQKIPTLAVKLGEKGGIARQGSLSTKADALKINVIDTIGAGDSFDAGFIYGYLNKYLLQDSLEIACACGSLSTQAAGGVAAQPTLQDLEEYGLRIYSD